MSQGWNMKKNGNKLYLDDDTFSLCKIIKLNLIQTFDGDDLPDFVERARHLLSEHVREMLGEKKISLCCQNVPVVLLENLLTPKEQNTTHTQMNKSVIFFYSDVTDTLTTLTSEDFHTCSLRRLEI